MALPGVDEHEIQLLFTDEEVTFTNLSDEAQMLRVAEALKADNVRVRRLTLCVLGVMGTSSFHSGLPKRSKMPFESTGL
jgi:hypothetical protein